MYVYYNALPKGFHVDDCVKRAISVTARMDYMEVQRELNRYKRASGAELFYSERNPHAYVERVLGAKRISFAHRKGIMRMTAAKFCKAYPKGRYILDMEGHWGRTVEHLLEKDAEGRGLCRVFPQRPYRKPLHHILWRL